MITRFPSAASRGLGPQAGRYRADLVSSIAGDEAHLLRQLSIVAMVTELARLCSVRYVKSEPELCPLAADWLPARAQR